MTCERCPGCGQFCEYPACQPGYVEPPPVDLAALERELLLYAATWEPRMAARVQLKDATDAR